MKKIIIVRGLPSRITVTAKGLNDPCVVALEPTDSAVAYFSNKETQEMIFLSTVNEFGQAIILQDEEEIVNDFLPNNGGVWMSQAIPELDETPGSFVIELTAEQTLKFPFRAGLREDGSRSMSLCKCLIDFNVERLPSDSKAILYDIYVEDIGLK